MCSLATDHGAVWNCLRRHGRGHRRAPSSSGRGASSGRLAQRAEEIGGEVVEARPRLVEGGRGLGLAPGLVDDHVVDQHDPLAPVVEGAQLADDVQHGVGQPGVVAGDVGQVLDLPHDVVPEVPHQPAVQRGQVGEDR